MKNSEILVSLMAIIVIVVIIISNNLGWVTLGINFSLKNKFSQPEKYKTEALIYLKQRYNRDFEVTDVSYHAERALYKMKAYPKTEKQPTFNVVTFERTKNPEFRDDYQIHDWDKRTKELFTPILRNIFSTEEYYSEIKYSFPDIITDRDFNPEVILFDEMMDAYPDEIFLVINIAGLFQEVQTMEDEYNHIFELANYFLDKKITRVIITITYFDQRLTKIDFFNRLEINGFDKFRRNNVDSIQRECYIGGLINIKNIEDVLKECN
ncbi:MAG TPA: hypothetical protein VGE40_11865 [Bacilli bacterium]